MTEKWGSYLGQVTATRLSWQFLAHCGWWLITSNVQRLLITENRAAWADRIEAAIGIRKRESFRARIVCALYRSLGTDGIC